MSYDNASYPDIGCHSGGQWSGRRTAKSHESHLVKAVYPMKYIIACIGHNVAWLRWRATRPDTGGLDIESRNLILTR